MGKAGPDRSDDLRQARAPQSAPPRERSGLATGPACQTDQVDERAADMLDQRRIVLDPGGVIEQSQVARQVSHRRLMRVEHGRYQILRAAHQIEQRSSRNDHGVPGILNTAERFNLDPIGVLGGAQIGFDWQTMPDWVWGIEADIQASTQADATTCSKSCLVQSFTQVSQKLPWFGTLRGRVGWSNGPALLYVTGGWAYGQVATDYAINVAASGVDARSFRHAKSGWVAGAGIEAHVTGSWIAKVEYLYLDLGTVSDVFAYAAAPGLGTQTERSHIHDHVARLGLNYRWGDPIIARY